MSAERPIIWLGSTAAVVGLFVAFALCQSGRPGVITLSEKRTVFFAMTHEQAVAKASERAAPARLAIGRASSSKPATPKSNVSRSLPESSQSMIVAARASSAAVVSSGGASPLLRGLRANARAYQSQCLVPVQTVTPLAIAQCVPRVMDVLSTARSLRGPPAV